MEVSTLKTKNQSKKNWFLQSCDSCDQRNEKMEDRMISSFEPTGLVLIVPHRHDQPKQPTCLFYQSTKNHEKTRSKNHRQSRNDGSTRDHLEKIVGINSKKWQECKMNRKYNTRARKHIARTYIKMICTFALEYEE